jgi:hypothetical protein
VQTGFISCFAAVTKATQLHAEVASHKTLWSILMSFVSDIFDYVFVTLLEMMMVMLLIVDPGPVFHATRFEIASGTRKQYNSGNG